MKQTSKRCKEYTDAGQMDKGGEAGGKLVIAHGDRAELLELGLNRRSLEKADRGNLAAGCSARCLYPFLSVENDKTLPR